MIQIITPLGEFELGQGADAPPITKENIDEAVGGFKALHITEVELTDGSMLIIPESWRDNYAVRIYLDAPPPPRAPDAALMNAAKKLLNACTEVPAQSPAMITAMSNLNVAIIASEMPEAAKTFRAAIAQAETAAGD